MKSMYLNLCIITQTNMPLSGLNVENEYFIFLLKSSLAGGTHKTPTKPASKSNPQSNPTWLGATLGFHSPKHQSPTRWSIEPYPYVSYKTISDNEAFDWS